MAKKQKKTKEMKLQILNDSGFLFHERSSWPEQFADITSNELDAYDHFIVAFSGGKDSVACFLHLLDLGVPKSKIELWHHLVDGREGSELMDWPVTEDYCRKFGEAFGVPVRFSWKKEGFEGEMTKENSKTKSILFEDQNDNVIECGGKTGKPGTRLKFPQVSADLSVRWCSPYLKIMVCTMAINNQKRFQGKKVMVVSGERAQESSARSDYLQVELDASDSRNPKSTSHVAPDGRKRVVRYVDRCRPVHGWSEEQVWDIIKKYKVNPHIAYRLGWGRLSCMTCIFGNANQWASVAAVDSTKTDRLNEYEELFGVTIHRTKSVKEQVEQGTPYEGMCPKLIEHSRKTEYTDPIIVTNWEMPSGAFGESNGPT